MHTNFGFALGLITFGASVVACGGHSTTSESEQDLSGSQSSSSNAGGITANIVQGAWTGVLETETDGGLVLNADDTFLWCWSVFTPTMNCERGTWQLSGDRLTLVGTAWDNGEPATTTSYEITYTPAGQYNVMTTLSLAPLYAPGADPFVYTPSKAGWCANDTDCATEATNGTWVRSSNSGTPKCTDAHTCR